MSNVHVSEATRRRIRDWIVEERSFTLSYASWCLGRLGTPTNVGSIKTVVVEMLDKDALKLIEDHGRLGKVYEYVEPKPAKQVPAYALGHFRELDDAHLAGIGVEAQQRGVVVPHTRAQGSSGRPGRDRKRQERGIRVKRARQGT